MGKQSGVAALFEEVELIARQSRMKKLEEARIYVQLGANGLRDGEKMKRQRRSVPGAAISARRREARCLPIV